MARIGVITFLHNENYGSSLQAYALQRALREMGHACEHIDYQPDRAEKIRNLLRSGNHPKLILEGLRKRSVQEEQDGARLKHSAILRFYAEQMKLSPPCRSGKELSKLNGRYDLLLCGSDQIWNPVWLNPVYFLSFAGKGVPKAAYAASMGVRELENARKIRMIRQLTEDFRAVSLREEEGAALFRRITGRDADVMPDPVCLLSPEAWKALGDTAPAPEPEEKPCLLCYFIGENPAYWEQVRETARETGLPVRVIPVAGDSYASGYPLLEGLGPEGFVRAVFRAEALCTDSFHGLVFATLAGIRTVLMRRYREDDPESKNSRIDHFRRSIAETGPADLREKGLGWLKKQIG